MSRLQYIISFLLFIFPFRICAQEQSYAFQHITSKDGLAADKANCILQDSKGYYWVGTDNGLQKFDGKNFSDILSGNADKNGISSIVINAPLLEDKEGNIWAHSGGSISVYHPLTGKSENIEIHDYTANSAASAIQHFCKDEWGDMWMLTYQNLYKYDYKIHKAVLWSHVFFKVPGYPWAKIIYDHTEKSLWIVGGPAIIKVDIRTKKFSTPFLNHVSEKPMLHEALAYQYPVGLFMDGKQNLWFSVWQGFVYKFNTLNFQKTEYAVYAENDKSKKQYKPLAYCFEEDENGKIWIGCFDQGFFYYDEKKDSIQLLPVNNKIPYFILYEKDIFDLSRDDEGNMLACTNKGISIFSSSSHQFNTLDENNLLNPFPETSVTRVFETSTGNILIATWGHGWLLYDKSFRLKKQFYNSDPPTDWQQYKKNMVWSFAEDHDGKIWIGYQYGLLGIYDTITQHIQYMNVPEFDKKTIRAMACDAEGNIWFGLHSGFLGKWDAVKHKFFIYKNSLQFINEYARPISNILINSHGEIWIATDGNGFYRFDPEQEKIAEKYSTKKQDSTVNFTNSLSQINDSIIGVATASKGVLLFNEKQKKFTSITIQDGLPVNNVYGLAQDRQKNLWIATTNGLLRMNPKNHKLVLFDEEDGVLAKDFDYNITSLHDGRMVVPASTGIVYFSPDSINELLTLPRIRITGFKVYDRSLLIDSVLSGNKTIELDHTQNFITINYASLSFQGRNTLQYFYRLEGVNKDWINAGKQRFASYTNLSPGHYTFKVKCESRDGVSSKKITSLSIYIHPPWWFSWWAYCLYVLAAGSIVYYVYKNHINRLEKKQAAEIKAMIATQEDERKRISRDLHDDVGTKLSALKLFLSSLGEKAASTNNEEIKSLAKSSEQFIKEAMRDVRQLLLNLSPTVLEEFGYTVAVEGLVNKINEAKQIHFNLVVFGMKNRLQKDYELALYRITQELINNVLKHAEAKHVSLQIGQRDEKIILMIEDDGKGFDITAHKDGYGLNNLNARTKLMGGTMILDSHPGNGTSVLIEIPYNLNEV